MTAPDALIIGSEPCGCRVVERVSDSSVRVDWCPMHAGAEGVQSAARTLIQAWDERGAEGPTVLNSAIRSLGRVA